MMQNIIAWMPVSDAENAIYALFAVLVLLCAANVFLVCVIRSKNKLLAKQEKSHEKD